MRFWTQLSRFLRVFLHTLPVEPGKDAKIAEDSLSVEPRQRVNNQLRHMQDKRNNNKKAKGPALFAVRNYLCARLDHTNKKHCNIPNSIWRKIL